MLSIKQNHGKVWALIGCLLYLLTTPSFAASVRGTLPSGDLVDIEIVKTPKLKYPRRAQRLDVEGFVLLGFDLSKDGEILDLRVIESQPRLVFDKSAMKFVSGFEFAVPEEDGNAVPATNISFRVRFRLQ
jgi:protein TonB